MDPIIIRLDIIPLYTPAGKTLFGDRTTNKKSITVQGWGPLNCLLLGDCEIKNSMEASDHKIEYAEPFGTHYGEPLSTDEELTRTEGTEEDHAQTMLYR